MRNDCEWIFQYSRKNHEKFRITDEVYYVIYYNVRTARPKYANDILYEKLYGTYKRP